MAKIQAYELQDKGLDTIEANEELGYDADYRQYTLPAEMLKQLGVRAVRLISNNPEKVAALRKPASRWPSESLPKSNPTSTPRNICKPKKTAWVTCSPACKRYRPRLTPLTQSFLHGLTVLHRQAP